MQKDDEIRLRHMLDAAGQALDFAREPKNMTRKGSNY